MVFIVNVGGIIAKGNVRTCLEKKKKTSSPTNFMND